MRPIPPEDPMRTRATDSGAADGWRGARLGAEARDRARRAARHVHAEIEIGEPGTPRVTVAFLALTILVTIWEFATYGSTPTTSELARAGGSSVGAIANGAWWKLLVANLLHGGVVHVLSNAFVMYLTGRWLEHLVGRAVVFAVILWSALLASAGSLVIDAAAVTIGASGVAFGIIGCAIAADPRAKTATGQIARQLGVVNVFLTFIIPGISKGGHVGGLVAGLVIGATCWRRERTEAHPAGRSRRVVTWAAIAIAVPIVVLLAVGPSVLPDHAIALRSSTTAPLLARQLSGAQLSSGQRIDTAHCDGTSNPRVYDCVVDGEDGVVTFRRSDDQWSLTSRR
jgi:membrane associated rhomboid family serine protease